MGWQREFAPGSGGGERRRGYSARGHLGDAGLRNRPGAAGSQPLRAPAGSVPRRGRTSWVTHRAATRAARTPERSAAESCRGRRGSRRPPGSWAAGCSGDRAGHGSAEATPLRRGSGQARASRARRPPRPPPAAAATPPSSRQLFPSRGLRTAYPLDERSPGQPRLQRDAWRPPAKHTEPTAGAAGPPALVPMNSARTGWT